MKGGDAYRPGGMVAVDDTDASNPADSEADYATAAQRFARSALNQLRDRASSQALLDSMTRLAEVTDPADTSGFKLMSGSHARSAAIRESSGTRFRPTALNLRGGLAVSEFAQCLH
ncbi:Uncharacterised protein [Mycobacteroides abscessus subsp. bolletii]|nr:Uncharacterised protein [Mycobacteroides abscessus subsp. bolletii]SHT33061.1 Uncharacterised protein [Mycobacteroides abscessus subsp. bolletii]SHT51294.1 Uncharacterised protein [Mycobacteroides abscessus subsp. bolletii]SKG64670.1 Uncharacterised protein [Mycobacteroides abscessus subsp. bolletii]SKH19794.1 Uncharacterised protein [Mycobacteroides abscessus subsp. bolletii]